MKSQFDRYRNNVGGGGGVVFKNAIFIAVSGVSRQFRPTNSNLTLKMAMSLRHNLMDSWRYFNIVYRIFLYNIDGHTTLLLITMPRPNPQVNGPPICSPYDQWK